MSDRSEMIVPKTPKGHWPKWVVSAVASQITSSNPYMYDARRCLDALEEAINRRSADSPVSTDKEET